MRNSQPEQMFSGLIPEADIDRGGRMSQTCQNRTHHRSKRDRLLDHLVGACDDLRWHREAKCLSGLEVYAQLDLHGLLDR